MEYAVINVLFLLQKGKDGALGLKKRVFEPFWAVFAPNCIIRLYHNMIRILFSCTFLDFYESCFAFEYVLFIAVRKLLFT